MATDGKVKFINPITGDEDVYDEVTTDTAADISCAACVDEYGIDQDQVWVEWPVSNRIERDEDDADVDFEGQRERNLIADGKF